MTRKRLAAQCLSNGPTPDAGVHDSASAVAGDGDRSRDGNPAAGTGAARGSAATLKPILIEIDPVLRAGYLHGRFDIMVRGRVVSAAAIEEIRLQVDGWVTGASTFGHSGRGADALMPDGSAAWQRAFQFNVPRPKPSGAKRLVFEIIARAGAGFEHTEEFAVDVDPTAAEPASVVSGVTRSASSQLRPDVIAYIERAAINAAGVLCVRGWAISLGPIIAVDVFSGEKRLWSATAGEQRDDVAAAYPDYPGAGHAGFSLTLRLDDVDHDLGQVRAQVVCSDDVGHQEAVPVERVDQIASASGVGSLATLCVSAKGETPVARQKPATGISMFCDAAELTGDGMLSLSGWAVCEVGIIQVRVLLDDSEVGLAALGHKRPDVGANFVGVPMARLSGFQFDRRISDSFEGAHELRIVVTNMRGDEEARHRTIIATAIPKPPAEQEAGLAKEGAEPTSDADAEFRFELDAPVVADGAAVALVTGRLTIDGWVLTRSGIASFEVLLDGQRLGDAHHGLARQDVGAAFPEWPNALRSGYAFHCPPRSLRDGDHAVELRIRSNNGRTYAKTFDIKVKRTDDQQDAAAIRRRVPRVEADMMLAILADMRCRPEFQFILLQDRLVNAARMGATLDALRLQAYPDWTVLVLAHDDAVAAELQVLINATDVSLLSRFSMISPSDAGMWSASLAGFGHGRPMLHLLLRPGDVLSADALLELAVAHGRHPGREMLYGDEVRISPVSNEKEAFLKPDFSIDLLLSTNYIGRPWAVTTALLATTAATAGSLIADGEYDLVLRCVEHTSGVHHIAKVLCQRSDIQLDDTARERSGLERMLGRRGIAAEILATPISGTWRIKRAVPALGKVSIIVPTCAAHGYIEACIDNLRTKTAYRDIEIVCIDNIPAFRVAWKVWLKQNADKVVEIPGVFNWSSFNNQAAEVADGEFLLFLNDDIEIIQDDWLDALMEHARRPEVGVTGARLLYPDGTVQHAGMFLSNNQIGRHAFRFAAGDDPGYFGLALTQRNVMAVTGACMLVRREVFNRLGGFNTAHEIVNNDLDFCLRAHRSGLLTVFTPYATLVHHELASRAGMKDVFDLTHFNAAWKTMFAAGDPYFNPRLSRQADDYRPDDEPVQWVVSGAPMFRVEEINRILVVKLDHIGDFVTALQPIRRLKKLFPHACISVLASPPSRAFVALEACIDEFIPFAFFHARSQLGERDLTSEDYATLAEQLRPYRFDLAVDLRKHLSTRDVLKHTGARFLAGFDYLGQFPFLDIALDWDGDRSLQRKRSHIVDDLMALVNAIGHASEADRVVLQPGPEAMPLTALPDDVRALFTKPVVAIHAGAGNVTKQWPKAHFSALIDLLVERGGVNVLLVGGPDEVGVADALLSDVLDPAAIRSMAGKTSLSDLARLLKNCALFIGNDSGPKHIAAAVGIPTIGIHSGVVDPVEWGPIGPTAVALRRNMTCSPCYLANAEDCPRSLACLRFLEPSMVYEAADLLLTPTRSIVSANIEAGACMQTHLADGSSCKTITDVEPNPRTERKPKLRRRHPAIEPA